MSEIKFEIKEHIAVLNSFQNGWTKELNLVSWNDADPKYDIREWSPDHAQMSRGITIRPSEMKKCVDALRIREI